MHIHTYNILWKNELPDGEPDPNEISEPCERHTLLRSIRSNWHEPESNRCDEMHWIFKIFWDTMDAMDMHMDI